MVSLRRGSSEEKNRFPVTYGSVSVSILLFLIYSLLFVYREAALREFDRIAQQGILTVEPFVLKTPFPAR